MERQVTTLICPQCSAGFVYAGHFKRHMVDHRVSLADTDLASVEELEAAVRVADASMAPWRHP